MKRDFILNYKNGKAIPQKKARELARTAYPGLSDTPPPPGHGRVVRVLIYEGEEEWLAEQLGVSMVDGVQQLARGAIHVVTLNVPE